MNKSPMLSQQVLTGGPAMSSTRSAALLIDFDNVTMNVRSDLGKELKSLLDSDVFRGKIAVRRAYADWRRYPASVVPLTEASVDLIFAPAYGTSKKNATDLRMAVDAIELAFMRPEIGVFILLTGDSDFSSCVMKLKEYGKYVIGVGMRESASDLLIQNCDEYYSYHNLSGLTRATDDTGVRENPWELVTKAATLMARRGDVMRVDRLKQVMVELDPGFSEKDIGYGKFSKFITEAQQRGAVRLRRTDGGDWEVAPPRVEEGGDDAAPASGEARPDRERGRDRDRDRGRGRGRFGDRYRDRDGRGGERPRTEAPAPIAAAPTDAEPVDAFEASVDSTRVPAASVPVFNEPDVETQAPAAEVQAPAAEPASTPAPAVRAPSAPPSGEAVDPLRNAYALLQHALRQMVKRPGDTARDGDLKRRMLEIQPGFDEHTLGFSKFNRFLRQAHDAEVVDVRRQEDGGYEVLLPAGGKRLPEPVLTAGAPQARAAADTSAAPAPSAAGGTGEAAAGDRGGRGGRGRGRGRGAPAGPPPLLPGQVVGGGDAQPAEAQRPAARAEEPAAAPAEAPEMTPAQAIQEADDGALVTHREPAVPTAQLGDPASVANRGSSTSAGAVGIRGGRGRRGGTPSGPPPLLPGQVISVGGARPQEPAPQVVADDPQPEPRAEAPRVETPAEEPAAQVRGGRSRGGRGRGRGAEEAPAAQAQPAAVPAFDPAALGLPSDRDGIVQRVASYNFVGRATGEALVDAYGAEVWRTLDENPDAVRELLGARKARPLLEQWGTEREQLIASAPAPTPVEEAPAAEPEPQPAEAVEGDTDTTSQDAAGGRSRRGGRGRGRGRASADETAPAQAEAVVGDTDPTLVGDAGTGAAPAGDDDAQTPAAQAEEVVGDTDPTLMGDAVLTGEEGTDARRGRSRSRRGGRGRSRGGRGDADAADAPAAEAPAEAPAPEPAPAPEAAAEDRPARGRGRGRGRGGNAAAEAPAAEAPAPEAAPAVTTEPAARGGRGRGRRGGTGAGAAAPAEGAAPAPAPEPAPAGDEGGAAGARRPRRRGGRGRGGNRGREGGAAE